VNLLTATLIAPSVPVLLRQQSAEGDSYQRQEVKTDALVAKLRARVDEELGEVVPAESGGGSGIPFMFGLAKGRRC